MRARDPGLGQGATSCSGTSSRRSVGGTTTTHATRPHSRGCRCSRRSGDSRRSQTTTQGPGPTPPVGGSQMRDAFLTPPKDPVQDWTEVTETRPRDGRTTPSSVSGETRPLPGLALGRQEPLRPVTPEGSHPSGPQPSPCPVRTRRTTVDPERPKLPLPRGPVRHVRLSGRPVRVAQVGDHPGGGVCPEGVTVRRRRGEPKPRPSVVPPLQSLPRGKTHGPW